QKRRPGRIVGCNERERVGEELRRGRVRGQRHRSLPCGAQRLARPLHENGIVLDTGGPSKLERLLVVVGEQLAVVFWAAEGFDPLSGAAMLLRAGLSRNLSVRDVAQQYMLERVLRVVGDRRSPLPPNEVFPLQRAQ